MKKHGWLGGKGIGLLGLAGGLIGGPSLAGIGSYIGTKGGEALAGEVDDVRDTDFGVGATEDVNRNIGDYRTNANTMAIGRGITDAFSAYVAPEMLSKARERITNLPARQFGIGGDKFANRVTQETLSDPRMSWLKAEQGLTESQANDLFWSEGASPSPSPAVTPSPSPTVTSSSTISKTPADPVNQRAIISQHLNNQPVLTPVNPTAPVQPNVLTQAMQPPYKQDRTTYRSPDSIRMEQWKNLLLKNNNLAQQLVGGNK